MRATGKLKDLLLVKLRNTNHKQHIRTLNSIDITVEISKDGNTIVYSEINKREVNEPASIRFGVCFNEDPYTLDIDFVNKDGGDIKLSSDGNILLVRYDNCNIKVFDLSTKSLSCISTINLTEHFNIYDIATYKEQPVSLAINIDNKYIYIGLPTAKINDVNNAGEVLRYVFNETTNKYIFDTSMRGLCRTRVVQNDYFGYDIEINDCRLGSNNVLAVEGYITRQTIIS